jgi:hypothetical protein
MREELGPKEWEKYVRPVNSLEVKGSGVPKLELGGVHHVGSGC